jgi:predicted HTH domain antitoxin
MIQIPDEILLALRETEQEVIFGMKKIAALHFYMEKKLSLGQCSELAGLSEAEFIHFLSSYKKSIFQVDSKEELLEDLKNA